MPLTLRRGTVTAIGERLEGLVRLEVDGEPFIAYPRVTGPVALGALERTCVRPTLALTGGGADANVFNERGLQCVNLANGMVDIHTPDERIAVDDLERMVEVTLALVEAARGA